MIRGTYEDSQANEFIEHINEVLRMVKEQGETIAVTEQGKVIARVVPTNEQKSSFAERDAAAWEDLKRIASELGPYWPENTDVVEIVHDIRRDL
ncbi:MAG TPA: hypothetical protein VFA09_06330 [Ktedonobacteraceae bacterium]|nr:hypothetical protein [Ktedonobacteraceae bacterium]